MFLNKFSPQGFKDEVRMKSEEKTFFLFLFLSGVALRVQEDGDHVRHQSSEERRHHRSG